MQFIRYLCSIEDNGIRPHHINIGHFIVRGQKRLERADINNNSISDFYKNSIYERIYES